MSQPSTISTMGVIDETGDLSPTRTYERYSGPEDDKSVFLGENHTPTTKDTLSFYRRPAKRNGNFFGVNRTSLKFHKDVTVPGIDGLDVNSAVIVELNISAPAGAESEALSLLKGPLRDLLFSDILSGPTVPVIDDLVNTLQI